MNLILASSSPRRIQLLREQGYNFTIVDPVFDELNDNSHKKDIKEIARSNSKGKGMSIELDNQNCIVLSADTIVVLDEMILGKPSSEDDALQMLLALNNNTHSVFTAYTIIRHMNNRSEILFDNLIESKVSFGSFDKEEYRKYIISTEPMGKAGAYAIQGLGSRFIKNIEGSYTNIVGLPVFEVMRDLNSAGIPYPWE